MSNQDFEPIAIVGQACVLPGALSPQELCERVLQGHDLLTAAPPLMWRTDPASLLAAPGESTRDRSYSDRGGYVRDFRFDPAGYALPAEELSHLDGLSQFVLHTARVALRDAGYGDGSGPRMGAVFGNLSYP